MTLLKAKRCYIKASLTRLQSFLDRPDDDSGFTYDGLSGRLIKLEESYTDFKEIEMSILAESENPDELADDTAVLNFEEKYYQCRERLLTLMYRLKRKEQPVAHSDSKEDALNLLARQQESFLLQIASMNNSFVRQSTSNATSAESSFALERQLPKIKIPPFSGALEDWITFKDARNLIKHLPISDANYDEAWDKLLKRYDRKGPIANGFIKRALSISTVSNPTPVNLRKFSDGLDEIVRGLRALGAQAESRDIWIIHIFLQKLDKETCLAWAKQSVEKDEDFPSLQTFLSFLVGHCEMLEQSQVPTRSQSKSFEIKPSAKVHLASAQSSCPKCQGDHILSKCRLFDSMDLNSRREFVKVKRLCFNCLRAGHSSKSCHSKVRCYTCNRNHHTSVHLPPHSTELSERGVTNNQSMSQPLAHNLSFQSNQSGSPPQTVLSTTQSNSQWTSQALTRNQPNTGEILANHSGLYGSPNVKTFLPTAIAKIFDVHNKPILVRVLLDTGSTNSFITEALSQALGLRRKSGRIPVNGLCSVKAGQTRGSVSFTLNSRFNQENLLIEAFILDKITSMTPTFSSSYRNLEHLMGLELADPEFNIPGKIDILLGATPTFKSLRHSTPVGSPEQPFGISTIFGWVITGQMSSPSISTLHESESASTYFSDLDVDKALTRFWELEELNLVPSSSPEDQSVENHFNTTHKRSSDGKYVVELPFNQNPTNLGNSYQAAAKRLYSMERRLESDGTLRDRYDKFMKEYISLGHMSLIPPSEIERPGFYLPHHAVHKLDSTSTKLRVVFDASAKSSNGISLNDCLFVGPSIQNSLFNICSRFRTHKYVFSADVEKMFRQIWVAKGDQDFQRILWRASASEVIQHYRLHTVTYGTAPAPFLAIRTLRQIASDYRNENPKVAKIIEEDFYMDDVLSGGDSIEEVLELREDLARILRQGGLHLRKWSSNCWNLLAKIQKEEQEMSPLELDKTIKVLGLRWIPGADVFTYKISLPLALSCSKRQVLSDASKIFDPLGFVAPVIICFKILFQELWLLNLNWDDELPPNSLKAWTRLRGEMSLIEKLVIPRRLWHNSVYELHGFCDASEKAYAAVVYARSKDKNGQIRVVIIAAKTKVAPLKQITIARLELCAALLLTRLFAQLKASLKFRDNMCFAWTDSQIVLAWLSVVPKTLKTFMANRTSEILSALPRNRWYHVRSASNPADCASRGILPSALIDHELWWNGPTWLKLAPESWPSQNTKPTDAERQVIEQEERNSSGTLSISEGVASNRIQSNHATLNLHITDRCLTIASTWNRLVHLICYIVRCTNKWLSRNVENYITTIDINRSKSIIIGHVQRTQFAAEFELIAAGRSLPTGNKLTSLTPMLDQDNLLRVGGRLTNSSLSFHAKHPLILPKDHIVTKLIIEHTHKQYLHVGAAELFVILRQSYWIFGCRNLCRKVVSHCISCFRQRNQTSSQLMADLPSNRVTYARPFGRVGCDYAGPIQLRLSRGRNPKFVKGYIVLFICMTTKAIHIELASDLTTDAFLAALRRFIARRGRCNEISSDNGTNFKGASRYLTDLQNLIYSKLHNVTVSSTLAMEGITWKYIPPNAPHFGGLWESNIRSIKLHLRRCIGTQILTYEEMYTLLTQIEAVLNSRPLASFSDSEQDVLTPAHFLIGQPYTALPDPALPDNINLLSNWQLLQQMLRSFWRRWHASYLTSLQPRTKWRSEKDNLKIGDIVTVKEDNQPPASWSLGRILDVHPGNDKRVRVVTVKTSAGQYKRPISKVARLPIAENPDVLQKAGECSGFEAPC